MLSLDACDFTLTETTTAPAGSSIRHQQVILRADLRNYDFVTVYFTPGPDAFSLRISRREVNNRIVAQLQDIIDVANAVSPNFVAPNTDWRSLLETDVSAVSLRVMAEIITSDDGAQTLVPHSDAPDFHRFSQAVEARPAPASYRSTTAFASAEQNGETFLMGEVVAVPDLEFTLANEQDAIALTEAFNAYAQEHDCR